MDLSYENEDLENEKKPNLGTRILMRLDTYMISNTNRKLKAFNIVISIVLFVDIFITSFLIGNYNLIIDEESGKESTDFLNHHSIYTTVIAI